MLAKISHKIFLIIFLIFYAFLLLKPISLTTSDLGRHITNGLEVLQGHWEILFTNTYSSVMPNQSFINHHWLSGVIFAVFYKISGFVGLQIFHALVLMIGAGLFYWLLAKKSSWKTADLILLPALIFFAARTEVRPESFGFLFFILELHWAHQVLTTKKIPSYSWWAIPLLHFFWVNIHISFVFSLFTVGALLFTVSFWKKAKLKKEFLNLLITLGLITLLNPNHFLGAISPLTIFKDYGYRVFENQNLIFLTNYYRGPLIPFYFIFTILTGLALWFAPAKTSVFEKIMAVAGVILGFLALRNILIFVVMVFPLLVGSFESKIKPLVREIKFEYPKISYFLIVACFYGLLFLYVRTNPFFGKTDSSFAAGLKPSQEETLAALKNLPKDAKIFNNYDIGSAIIFAQYPKIKVFVDNRPEAYSSEFFNSVYIPMQQKESVWQEQLALHDFQYLVFGHRDITPWAQHFLKQRLKDSEWAVIYLDEALIIFAKRNQKNQSIIQEKEILIPLSRLGI